MTRIGPLADNADESGGDVPRVAPVTVGGGEVPGDGSDGGDAACWAHLLCPDCGVVLDGSAHDPTCEVTPEALLRGDRH